MALTPILRKLRVPAAVLTLVTFFGLFFLMTTDAGAYADGLPRKQFVHQAACDGDPDTPDDFTDGHPGAQDSELLADVGVLLHEVLVLARLVL